MVYPFFAKISLATKPQYREAILAQLKKQHRCGSWQGMEKGGHLQSADSADCTVPSRMVPSSCGKGSDSLCHSSCTSRIAIFRQPLCCRSPFNPVPKMLTEEASQGVDRDCGKLLLFWPCATSCHLHQHLHARPQAWVQPEPWLCAGMRETHQSGRQGSILRSGKQQDVTSSSVCATGNRSCRNMSIPYDIKMQHWKNLGVPAVIVQSSSHMEVWDRAGGNSRAGRSLSWREADCVASLCKRSAPSMCCNKQHEDNSLPAFLCSWDPTCSKRAGLCKASLSPTHLPCPLLLITLAWASLWDCFSQGENHLPRVWWGTCLTLHTIKEVKITPIFHTENGSGSRKWDAPRLWDESVVEENENSELPVSLLISLNTVDD